MSVNVDKTKARCLGSLKGVQEFPFNLDWSETKVLGKITIVNTLTLSSLPYLASVIHVPSMVFKEVKHIVVDFISEGKTSKIAYDVLIQQTEEGGLKLVDFEDKVKSLKVIWVKHLTKDKKERWMAAPTVFYKTQNLSQHFLFNQDKIKMEPNFYEDYT